MKKSKKFLSFLLAGCMLLSITGCKKNADETQTPAPTASLSGSDTELPESFSEYLDSVFLDEAQCDTLSLHYLIANPENYGITVDEVTLGEYTFGVSEEDYEDIREYLNNLEHYDYSSLSDADKTTYDVFKNFLEQQLALLDYAQFSESLGPTTGLQAQLPILLAEYTFYDKKDVEDYIKILNDLPNYFSQVAQFQKDKSAAGYFMSDTTADQIIDQCKLFIEKPEENLLIECFASKLDTVPDLTKDDITLFTEQNREAVLNSVIPAYQTLIDTLTSLKGTGKNELGVCGFEGGAEYYQLCAQFETGSSMTMDEMNKLLESTLSKSILDMSTLQMTDPLIMQKYNNISYPGETPEEMLEYLKTAISEDFPLLEEVNYDVKYIHESLREHLSPAMYLTPPVDEVNLHNNIYINAAEGEVVSDLFPTIAHEGYPGHLYQTVYFFKTNPSMIRRLTEPTGYVEGWATYVEYYSYELAGIDKNLAKLMQDNMLATHCLYSLSDIGINYYGWTLSDTEKFWATYGFDSEIAKLIYDTMVAEPGIYLPYCIGALEFMQLRETAEEALGDNFSAKEFHDVILTAGPMPFDLLETFVNRYIEENSQSLEPAA